MRDLRRYAAVNGRLRALRGLLLGPAALEALYSYPNVEAMYEALRRTPYLNDVAARVVVAGRALIDCLDGAPRNLIHQYLLRYEVDSVKLAIRAVAARRNRSVLSLQMLQLGSLATVDVDALLAAHDLDELVTRLFGSPYHSVLQTALPRVDELGPFALESALEIDFYERLWRISYELLPEDGDRVRALLGVLYDILNLIWIAHYRDAALLSMEEILNYTLREGGCVTLQKRRLLAQTRDEWLGPLAGTPFEAFALRAERDGPDAALPQLWGALAGEVRRALRGYPFHAAAPLALLMAQELEIRDVQVLLAMKRLGVPAADALPNLVTGAV
ncbi:MAG: V-type ATPase subunit [Deltaproteobacteria bacterium]|nr:V-type ATPase subunit [Deltaproteobacteria bacterium]